MKIFYTNIVNIAGPASVVDMSSMFEPTDIHVYALDIIPQK